MDGLRRWMLLFCCGCILYGLLENLLPRRGTFPVIKAAVILYIILILLSPVHGIRMPLPEIREYSFSAVQEAPLPQDAVLQSAAAVLRQKLEKALAACGQEAVLTGLWLDGSAAELTGVRLRLQAGAQTDKAKVQRLCDGLLGMEGAYEWQDG